VRPVPVPTLVGVIAAPAIALVALAPRPVTVATTRRHTKPPERPGVPLHPGEDAPGGGIGDGAAWAILLCHSARPP